VYTFLHEFCSLDTLSYLFLVGHVFLADECFVQASPVVVVSLGVFSTHEQQI
jgi:hypothetical protein